MVGRAAMTRHVLLLMKKQKGQNAVLDTVKYLLRTLPPAANVDPTRSPDNVILRGPGTPHEVAALARSLLADAGIKPRKGAVQAVELVISLSPGSGIDEQSFFDTAVEWVGRYFAAPVLLGVIHRDQAQVHAHVLLLPLVDGHMIGSELVGGYGRLQATQADFYKHVAAPFGLTRPPQQERPSAANRRDTARSMLDEIKQRHGLLIGPEAEAELLDLIVGDMGKRTKSRSFVGIMTKPVTPEKPSPRGARYERREIGHEVSRVDRAELPPSPYLFKGEAPPAVPPVAPADTDVDADVGTTRHRDDDMPASAWNSDSGDFIRLQPASSRRVLASMDVQSILARHEGPVTRTETFQLRCRTVSSPLQAAGP